MNPIEHNKFFVWVGVGVLVAAAVLLVLAGAGKLDFFPSEPKVPSGHSGPSVPGEPLTIQTPHGEATVVAPGVSPITKSGEVLAPSGIVAKNDAPPGAGNSPQQSDPLQNNQVPADSIKIDLSDTAFTPASFTVPAKTPVTITFTAKMQDTTRGAIIVFEDPSLSGIIVSLLPGETRAIVFQTPSVPGSYIFYRKGNDTRGTMIVR